jgi:hypothetical protein
MTNAALTADRTVPNVGINGFGRIGMCSYSERVTAHHKAELYYDAASLEPTFVS